MRPDPRSPGIAHLVWELKFNGVIVLVIGWAWLSASGGAHEVFRLVKDRLRGCPRPGALDRGSASAGPARTVCVAQVKGTIWPTTASYLARALGEAAGRRAQCLVIELDTPGGLLDSTKEIVQSFLRAPVPTVVYVAPAGGLGGQRRLLHHHGRGHGGHGARHQHRRGPPGAGGGGGKDG